MNRFKKFIFSVLATVMVLKPLQVHGASSHQEVRAMPIKSINNVLEMKSNDLSNIYLDDINGTTMDLALPENVEIINYNSTHVRLIDTLTGETELLPTRAVTMDGVSVFLIYTVTETGLSIEVTPATRWKRCTVGTIGSAVGGGITGAIGGGMVGAASFC